MATVRVSQETLDEAKAFINPMERMMMMLDDLAFSETRVMNEQTYLEMGKALMEINELKNEVKETVIYRNAVRQARAAVMSPRLSAAEMAADTENYTCCPACKSYMTKRHFKEKHVKTKKCSHILQLRSFNAIKGTGEIKNKTARARKQKKEAIHTITASTSWRCPASFFCFLALAVLFFISPVPLIALKLRSWRMCEHFFVLMCFSLICRFVI